MWMSAVCKVLLRKLRLCNVSATSGKGPVEFTRSDVAVKLEAGLWLR